MPKRALLVFYMNINFYSRTAKSVRKISDFIQGSFTDERYSRIKRNKCVVQVFGKIKNSIGSNVFYKNINLDFLMLEVL